MTLQLSIELSEDLRWGDLIAFVDAARAHVDANDVVEVVLVEGTGLWIPDMLTVEIADVAPGTQGTTACLTSDSVDASLRSFGELHD